MMDGGRKQKWVNYNRKGPSGSWKPRVNTWEREFCEEVGAMKWGTFMYMKKFRHLVPNVLYWDDSASKEAFDDAWRRFWCKKKGYVCDVPLPDPDLYINVIDWDAKIDPELWREIEESVPVVRHTEKEDKGPIADSPVVNYQDIVPTGWGDEDEKVEHAPPFYTPHDLSGKIVDGWNSPAWPSYGPSHVPPPVGPMIVWPYPILGGGWGYASYNYVGPYGSWNYSHVGTSSGRAFGPSYKAQADVGQRNRPPRNGGGWRRPSYPKKQSTDQLQERRPNKG